MYRSCTLRWPYLSGIMMFSLVILSPEHSFCVCLLCQLFWMLFHNRFSHWIHLKRWRCIIFRFKWISHIPYAQTYENVIEQISFGDYFVAVRNENKKVFLCFLCSHPKIKAAAETKKKITEHWTPKCTISFRPLGGGGERNEYRNNQNDRWE